MLRPARDHFGDVFLGHFFAQQAAGFLSRRFFLGDLAQLFLELGNPAVLDLAGLGQIAAALGALELGPRVVELLFDLRAARR